MNKIFIMFFFEIWTPELLKMAKYCLKFTSVLNKYLHHIYGWIVTDTGLLKMNSLGSDYWDCSGIFALQSNESHTSIGQHAHTQNFKQIYTKRFNKMCACGRAQARAFRGQHCYFEMGMGNWVKMRLLFLTFPDRIYNLKTFCLDISREIALFPWHFYQYKPVLAKAACMVNSDGRRELWPKS